MEGKLDMIVCFACFMHIISGTTISLNNIMNINTLATLEYFFCYVSVIFIVTNWFN